MISIGFVLNGRRTEPATSKSSIIIELRNIDMIRIPTNRRATHPGEVLLKDFLEPLELTQKAVADALGVPFQRVNEIVSGKRGVTPSTALRLAKYFGNSPAFWLNLQMRVDLQTAVASEADALRKIKRTQRRTITTSTTPATPRRMLRAGPSSTMLKISKLR